MKVSARMPGGRDTRERDSSQPESQTADGLSPVAVNVYRFRAECQHDVDELRGFLGLALHRVTMTVELPFPDVEVEIETSLSLENVREAMRQVVDGHVMLQTVARSAEYTGVRNYKL